VHDVIQANRQTTTVALEPAVLTSRAVLAEEMDDPGLDEAFEVARL
jgi:hypothetical protein